MCGSIHMISRQEMWSMHMEFVKMHGLGNDFIMIDDTDIGQKRHRAGFVAESGCCESGELLSVSDERTPALVRQLCDRHRGIGADGVICVCDASHPQADFRMKLYNADGSMAQMCGNGIRCLGKYVYDHGKTEKVNLRIETDAGIRRLQLIKNEETDRIGMVRVDMGTPDFVPEHIPARFSAFQPVCVSMGNPHCVLFVDSREALEQFPLKREGTFLGTLEQFPEGVNVEAAWVQDPGNIRMRVWERGCGETFACGTGACAVAAAAMRQRKCGASVQIRMPGGTLQIQYDRRYGHLYLTGPAEEICRGKF